jgi:hypothetical protein
MMAFIIVFLIHYAEALLPLTACGDALYTNTTKCKMTGYCEVSGAGCGIMTDCYRASEVAACL